MATLDEISERFGSEFKLFGSYEGWSPVTFVDNGSGYCLHCDMDSTPIELIVRVECWIEESNQYFYSDAGVSIGIGENSEFGDSFDSLEECLKFVNVEAKIHPILRAAKDRRDGWRDCRSYLGRQSGRSESYNQGFGGCLKAYHRANFNWTAVPSYPSETSV